MSNFSTAALRRSFLKASALLATGSVVFPHLLRASGTTAKVKQVGIQL